MFSCDKNVSVRVEDTALWAQDLFQLSGGQSGSKEIADKNSRLGTLSICLLFCLGVAAGLINGLILMANAGLCKLQATFIIIGGSYGIGLLYFLVAMCLSVFLAALCCKHGSGDSAGSGLPQFKYILASEMTRTSYDNLLSFNVFIFKVIGLILSVGGGLSVGSEGPLVLIAACIAHLLMKYIIYFDDILDNTSLTKQILAASAAVGLGSAFNAPVGGLLFSIEVTSTFYLVSNYWKSFLAAMAGSVACSIFLITKDGANGDPLLVVEMLNLPKLQYWKWELIIYLLMGVSFGYLAHAYLYLHQKVSIFMKDFNASRPLVTAVTVAFITGLTVYITGAYTKESVGVIALVSDVVNKGKVTEMSFSGMLPMGGLFVMFWVRVILTLLGTNILVPAGIFMPVILMGGILGRFVGYFVFYCGHTDAFIPGYALVGAVAFSSGITHTISAAVIAVEMTGNLGMLLPCLIVAVVSAGITKSIGLSVYDQGMINKGLETFQLLLLGKHGNNRVASSVMDRNAASIPKKVHVIQLIKALELSAQNVYPVTEENNGNSMKLVGSVLRSDVFTFLMRLFEYNSMGHVLKLLLEKDSQMHEDRVLREIKKNTQKQRDNRILNNFTTTYVNTVEHISNTLDKVELFSNANYSIPSTNSVSESNVFDEHQIRPDKNSEITSNPLHSNNNNSDKNEYIDDNNKHSDNKYNYNKYNNDVYKRKNTKNNKNNNKNDHNYDDMNEHNNNNNNTNNIDSHDCNNPPTPTPVSTDRSTNASYVWTSFNTAAQSLVKNTLDALQFQESSDVKSAFNKDKNKNGKNSENRDDENENANKVESAQLLALFANEVSMELELQFHINLFPFRYDV